MANRRFEHIGSEEELAAAQALLDQAAPLFDRNTTPVALKVAEVISGQLLRRALPQSRAAIMERFFANVRQRVRGDA